MGRCIGKHFHLVHLWRVNAPIAPRGLVHLATAPHCSFTHSTSPCAQLVFHHHNVPLQRPPKLGVANMGTTDHMDVVRYMHMVPCGQNAGSTPGSDGVQPTTLRNVVQHMCDRGANPSAGDNHAIRTAAKHGHVDVVRYLCDLPPDRGVDPSARDNRAIWDAAQCGHLDVVRYLCDLPPDRGVDPRVWRPATDTESLLQVARYLSCLPSNRVRISNAIVASCVARRPVVALCALVLGRYGRCAHECAGRSTYS